MFFFIVFFFWHTCVPSSYSHFYKLDVSYAVQPTFSKVILSDRWRKWWGHIFKNYKGSGNEIKNLTILNSNEYKRQQLTKHQPLTADVDIKSWLKVLNKQF